MASRKRAAEPTSAQPVEPEQGAPTPPHARPGQRVLSLLKRPVVHLPLLILVGALAGYIVGAVRLSARERSWEIARQELETRGRDLESSLEEARTQEIAYRVLVSVSRIVVHLYDRNFGLAAEELRAARAAIAQTQGAADTDLGTRLEAFQSDLDDLALRVEEMSRSARDTMRDIERVVTTTLFPAAP